MTACLGSIKTDIGMPVSRQEFLDHINQMENGPIWLCIVVTALNEANITMGPKGEHIVLNEHWKMMGKLWHSSERGKAIGKKAVELAKAAQQ